MITVTNLHLLKGAILSFRFSSLGLWYLLYICNLRPSINILIRLSCLQLRWSLSSSWCRWLWPDFAYPFLLKADLGKERCGKGKESVSSAGGEGNRVFWGGGCSIPWGHRFSSQPPGEVWGNTRGRPGFMSCFRCPLQFQNPTLKITSFFL